MNDAQRERLMDEYDAAVIEVENRREDLADAEWDWEMSRNEDESGEAETDMRRARSELTDAIAKLESIKRQFPECRDSG